MKRIIAGVLALMLAACSTLWADTLDNKFGQIVITRFPEQVELGCYPLGQDRTFALSFIHSVSRTRVRDIYKIKDGQIVQTEEFFKAHGAGLPSSPEEPYGLSWEKTKDQFIFHMKRPIPKLVVRTDKNYQNRLILGSGIFNLNQWEDQALLIYYRH